MLLFDIISNPIRDVTLVEFVCSLARSAALHAFCTIGSRVAKNELSEHIHFTSVSLQPAGWKAPFIAVRFDWKEGSVLKPG